jgi:hypothetical protein
VAGVTGFDGWALKGVLVSMAARAVPVVALVGCMVQAAGLYRYFARAILMIFGSVVADLADILRTFLIYGSPVVAEDPGNIG